LVKAPARSGLASLRQFSTEVAPFSYSDIQRGLVKTTGGTDITCVIQDILASSINRVLIVSDGYVGRVDAYDQAELRSRGVEFVSVIPKNGWTKDLAELGEIFEIPEVSEYDNE
jgi:hypothetical protein